jgi:hypothetical protein
VRCEGLDGARDPEDLSRLGVVAQFGVRESLRSRLEMKGIYAYSHVVGSRLNRLLVASLGVVLDLYYPGKKTTSEKRCRSYSGLALVAAAFAMMPIVRESREDRRKVCAVDATV